MQADFHAWELLILVWNKEVSRKFEKFMEIKKIKNKIG